MPVPASAELPLASASGTVELAAKLLADPDPGKHALGMELLQRLRAQQAAQRPAQPVLHAPVPGAAHALLQAPAPPKSPMALELQAAVQQHREAQHRYLEQRDQVRAMLLARQLGPAGSPERAAQLARLKALKLQLAAAQQRQHELRAAREARLQHHQMQVQQGLLPQQPLQAAPAPQPAPLPYQQMLPGGDPAGLLAFQAAAAPLGPPPPLPPSAGLLASAAGGPMPPLGHAQPLPQAAGMPPLPTQRQRGLYEQPSLRPELEASSSMAELLREWASEPAVAELPSAQAAVQLPSGWPPAAAAPGWGALPQVHLQPQLLVQPGRLPMAQRAASAPAPLPFDVDWESMLP